MIQPRSRCAKRGSGTPRLPYRFLYPRMSVTPCSAAPTCARTGAHQGAPKNSATHAQMAHRKKKAVAQKARYASCVHPGIISEANQSHGLLLIAWNLTRAIAGGKHGL